MIDSISIAGLCMFLFGFSPLVSSVYSIKYLSFLIIFGFPIFFLFYKKVSEGDCSRFSVCFGTFSMIGNSFNKIVINEKNHFCFAVCFSNAVFLFISNAENNFIALPFLVIFLTLVFPLSKFYELNTNKNNFDPSRKDSITYSNELYIIIHFVRIISITVFGGLSLYIRNINHLDRIGKFRDLFQFNGESM